MEQATQSPADPGMNTILDVCRRVMLLDKVAGEFNELPVLEPTERVKKAAVVIIEAANRHDFVRDFVAKSGVMNALRDVARGRAGGDVLQLPTLLPDLPATSRREVHV